VKYGMMGMGALGRIYGTSKAGKAVTLSVQ
jgi:hypothetical protein